MCCAQNVVAPAAGARLLGRTGGSVREPPSSHIPCSLSRRCCSARWPGTPHICSRLSTRCTPLRVRSVRRAVTGVAAITQSFSADCSRGRCLAASGTFSDTQCMRGRMVTDPVLLTGKHVLKVETARTHACSLGNFVGDITCIADFANRSTFV